MTPALQSPTCPRWQGKLRSLYLWFGTPANINSPPLDISALAGLTELDTVTLFPAVRIQNRSPVEHVPNLAING